MPRLLVDSDIFCKLGMAGILDAAFSILGVTAGEAACLPALQHMLRRGKLRKTFGDANCDGLIPKATAMATAMDASSEWLDRLVGIDRIDIGEAQLFAMAATSGSILMTGDKRALGAVSKVTGFPDHVRARFVTLEAILLALCCHHGDDAICAAVKPLMGSDRMVQICFSAADRDFRGALRSYFEAAKRDVFPLVLWDPEAHE
jgi:hypothetical protein